MIWALANDWRDLTIGELLTEGKITIEDLTGLAEEKKAERERQETERLQARLDSEFWESPEPELISTDF